MSFLLLYDIFTETLSDYTIEWDATIKTDHTTYQVSFIADGTGFLIPRQYEVEMKWTFTSVKVNSPVESLIDFSGDPLTFRYSEHRYDERSEAYERLGQEKWINSWIEDMFDNISPELTERFLAHVPLHNVWSHYVTDPIRHIDGDTKVHYINHPEEV